jgi:hypothetical protein
MGGGLLTEDVVARIGRLSDREAVAALELVVQSREVDTDQATLQAQEEGLRAALAQPEQRREVEAAAVLPSAAADRGELARAALVVLVEEGGEYREAVIHALDRPAPVGTRDPLTLAIVGLVVLALRPKLDLQRDPQKGWRFRLQTEPLKDSAMGKLLGKLLSAVSPASAGQ